MKPWLRSAGLLVVLLSFKFVAPANACWHSYCSVTCYGTEYFLMDYTYQQCCSNPDIINACGGGWQYTNYWFNGCTGRNVMCPVEVS